MKLSIIIPIYNSSKLLDNCLDHFNDINYCYEIIIVDNNSSDCIKDVLVNHSNLPIIYHRDSDFGIYDAFNKGVKYSTGDIIFFMGSDDIIHPDLFRAAKLFSSDLDLLVGGITIGGEVEFWKPGFIGYRLLFRNIPHQAILLKRDYILNNPYSLKYPILSDYAWSIAKFWSKNTKFSYVNKIFCEWSPGGVSYVSRDYEFEADKFNLIKKHAPKSLFLFYFIFKLFFKKK